MVLAVSTMRGCCSFPHHTPQRSSRGSTALPSSLCSCSRSGGCITAPIGSVVGELALPLRHRDRVGCVLRHLRRLRLRRRRRSRSFARVECPVDLFDCDCVLLTWLAHLVSLLPLTAASVPASPAMWVGRLCVRRTFHDLRCPLLCRFGHRGSFGTSTGHVGFWSPAALTARDRADAGSMPVAIARAVAVSSL